MMNFLIQLTFLLDKSSPVTSYLEQYKSDCRVDSLFQKNTDYLVWDKTSVRLNAKHEEFFRQLFDGSYRCVLNVLYSVVDNVTAYQAIQTKWLGFNKINKQVYVKPLPHISVLRKFPTSIALISQLSSRSLSFSWLVSLVQVRVELFVNWLVLVGMLILLNIRSISQRILRWYR